MKRLNPGAWWIRPENDDGLCWYSRFPTISDCQSPSTHAIRRDLHYSHDDERFDKNQWSMVRFVCADHAAVERDNLTRGGVKFHEQLIRENPYG